MLLPDECLPFLKIRMDRYAKREPDVCKRLGGSVETITRLSYDGSHSSSLVISDIRQINFDLYARLFQEDHQRECPSSCDGLSKSALNENLFCFVEYKNGNIVAYDQKRSEYSIKESDAKIKN